MLYFAVTIVTPEVWEYSLFLWNGRARISKMASIFDVPRIGFCEAEVNMDKLYQQHLYLSNTWDMHISEHALHMYCMLAG